MFSFLTVLGKVALPKDKMKEVRLQLQNVGDNNTWTDVEIKGMISEVREKDRTRCSTQETRIRQNAGVQTQRKKTR